MSEPQRPPIFAPFRIRSFRFQWPADLATSWATEMEVIILGWFILVETDSVLILTLFASLNFIGTLLAPMFGLLGDRIGHRNLLCLMRASYTLLAASLMILAFAEAMNAVNVFVIAALSGAVRSSDLVMRNAIIGGTIPANQLVGAMSISRTTADSARIAGALAGAWLTHTLGIGPSYAAITGFYAISFFLTLGVAGSGPAAHTIGEMAGLPQRASPWRELIEGMVYIWRTPYVLAAMYLAFLVNLTAYPISNGLLPYVAREVYHVDQTGLGYLVAGFACGALTGSILLTTLGAGIKAARMMIFFAAVWHVVLLAFSQIENATLGIAMMYVAGLSQSLSLVPMSVLLLRGADARFRGRVLGVRMLAVYGLPMGLVLSGPVIDHFGFSAMNASYAVIGLIATLAIGIYWRRELWPAEAAANKR